MILNIEIKKLLIMKLPPQESPTKTIFLGLIPRNK